MQQSSANTQEEIELLNPEEYIKIIGNDVTVQLENSTFVQLAAFTEGFIRNFKT